MSIIVDTERFHPNPYLEKENDFGDPFEKGPNSFQEKMKQALSSLIKTLTTNLIKEGLKDKDDTSVYTGISGILLTYHMMLKTTPEFVDASIKDLLQKFAQAMISASPSKTRFTFLCGDPLVITYLIASDKADRANILQRLLNLQQLVYANVPPHETAISNELLYGRVGYLFSLLFLNQQLSQQPPIIPSDVLEKLVSTIIEDGLKNSRTGGPSLRYEWHGKEYLGAAHGYVGILYILLKAREYMKGDHVVKVKETVDWVLSKQLPSGNLISSLNSKEDKLVHWCHGSPGAIFLFLEAAKVFGNSQYLNSALACGEVVWNRGILKRSYSLCHGTAGNAYALFALYKHTKDSKWLRRSCLFAEWCFTWGNSTRQPDRPNSLFEGLAGSVYMIHEFYNFLSTGGSGSPKFPAFELD